VLSSPESFRPVVGTAPGRRLKDGSTTTFTPSAVILPRAFEDDPGAHKLEPGILRAKRARKDKSSAVGRYSEKTRPTITDSYICKDITGYDLNFYVYLSHVKLSQKLLY
jgi:hypothetical protein